MSSSSLVPLFQPFSLKSLQLKNRIVMSPMTRSRSPEGVPTQHVAAYYRRRAEGMVGLLLSEGTAIDRPASRNESGIPALYGEVALRGWREVLREVHGVDGRMGVQLWHPGSSPGLDGKWHSSPVESPSGLLAPGKVLGDTMTDAAIADTIDAFARAAAEAKRLGFDVLEIHGAHGYLIDQFFWEGTNLRTDRYGGKTISERARFAAEVVRAVRAAVGPDFPMIFRVSQWKLQDFATRIAETPDAMAAWLTPLADAGIDMLDCSQRRFWEPEFPDIDGANGLNFAGWAKKLTGLPTMTVGSAGLDNDIHNMVSKGEGAKPSSLDSLALRLDRGEFDLVAVGRALLADPRWLEKIHAGRLDELSGFSPAALADLH
jgi:2,4-dienoyl-CoA reductase-like NADH-dependent reductase (Old Yellow Enzyme family)